VTSQQIAASNLLEKARAASGLSDFGDTWFLEPLERLVDAINSEGHLVSPDAPPVERIVQSLSDRLAKVQLLKSHPEIRDEPVRVAGAILGLPRTGSTMLQRLLASSDQLTATYWWEAAMPLPFPGEKPGDPTPRKQAAQGAVEAFYEAWPDFRSIHPMDALVPDEEVLLLDKTFLSSTYDSIMTIPSYGFWMAAADKRKSYEELREWLQILQWQTPARRKQRWILKSPHHLLGGLSGLLEVFPDCAVIMTHRAIEESLPSYCSMCASLTVSHTVDFDAASLGDYWTRRFETGLRELAAARRSHPDRNFIDIRYTDLLDDPVKTALEIVHRMGLEPSPADRAAMEAWLDANGRENRPPHKYAGTDFGLTQDSIKERFAFYTETFLT
jgi:hypothetical protein